MIWVGIGFIVIASVWFVFAPNAKSSRPRGRTKKHGDRGAKAKRAMKTHRRGLDLRGQNDDSNLDPHDQNSNSPSGTHAPQDAARVLGIADDPMLATRATELTQEQLEHLLTVYFSHSQELVDTGK